MSSKDSLKWNNQIAYQSIFLPELANEFCKN